MTDSNGQVVKEIFPEVKDEEVYGSSFGFMRWMAAAGETLPPWWSQERDRQLRIFTKNSDQLSGTVNMIQEMIGAISVWVEPEDNSVKAHRVMANRMSDVLQNKSESRSNLVEQGWLSLLGPFVNDTISQDNGGWIVVDGESDKDGLLIGPPTKLIHLDSYNCWRTTSREYPLIYTDSDGKRYKIHRSRVINITSSPDPSTDMYGVGFCPVSRCVNMVQRLTDISRYYQEKLGSRPPRGFLFVTGDGAERTVKAIENTVFVASERMDNRGLSRFSPIPVIGIRNGAVELISFSQLPDGFDEMTTVQIGVWVLSLAFGVDSRQLGFALGVAGQTKADAEIQHLKMQGKFPGWFINKLTQQLERKFLPRGIDDRPYLKIVFDQQDDAQDRAQAEIRKTRSEYRKTYMDSVLWTSRVAHEDMLETGDISDEQFIELELSEGRLEDGLSVMSLFDHPDYADLLITDNPEERLKELYALFSMVTRTSEQKRLRLAIAALEHSLKEKKPAKQPLQNNNGQQENNQADNNQQDNNSNNNQQSSDNQQADNQPMDNPQADTQPIDESVDGKKKAIGAYSASIRAAVRGLFNQDIDLISFINAMNSAIDRGFEQAWTEAALTCGIQRDERTSEEINQLHKMILDNKVYVFQFGDWIEKIRDAGGVLATALSRAEMWTNAYNAVYSQAQTMACSDQKLKWVVGPTEHCTDCANYSGRIYRASVWQKNGIRPQSRSLECGGYRCQCRLEPTDERLTRGRPPAIRGKKEAASV